MSTATALVLPHQLNADESRRIQRACPFYTEMVPKDPEENDIFRREMIRAGSESEAYRKELWIMCARDILFFCNTFCFILEPRTSGGGSAGVLQWITYPFQDSAILDITDAIGKHDLTIPKSRAMAGSWMVAFCFVHPFIFSPNRLSFKLISRKEDLVWNPGDDNALFTKIDALLDYLPGWLQPPMNKREMRYRNQATGTAIVGESTTAKATVGSRSTAVAIDEMDRMDPATQEAIARESQHVTYSRIMVSSVERYGTQFNRYMRDPNIKQLRLHWSMHPVFSQGMYRDENGVLTSPWREKEKKRAGNNTRSIATQIDIDVDAADATFFEPPALTIIENEHCREPNYRGTLRYDRDSGKVMEFIEGDNGALSLWCKLIDGRPPKDRAYIIGADVASGTIDASGRGSSNSTAFVLDMLTLEQVGELALHGWRPEYFSMILLALCDFFTGFGGDPAFLIWEDNGPGSQLRGRILESDFRHFYYRPVSDSQNTKQSEFPGYWSTSDSKIADMGDLRFAIQKPDLYVRSKALIDECRRYVYGPNGEPVHSDTVGNDDPSQARRNHGDRATAAMVCWKAAKPRIAMLRPEDVEPEYGTFAYIRAQGLKEAEAENAVKMYWDKY